MPTLIGSCLDPASPTRERFLAGFACSLSADTPCVVWQKMRRLMTENKNQQRSVHFSNAAVDGKNNARLVGGDEFQVEIAGPGNASPKPDIVDNNDG